MKLSKKTLNWEAALVSENNSFWLKFLMALIVVSVGLTLTFFFYQLTGLYFATLTIISVILVSLYCGFRIAFFAAIVQGLVADYFFIQPTGALLNTLSGLEHFLIIIGLAVFVSFLISSVRLAFHEMVLARQEAEKAKLEAQSASEFMEKALALVSHDIRNPLASIGLGAQLILKTPGQIEKHQHILSRMLSNIDRADSMIQSLLDVESIRAGKSLHLEFLNCDLSVEVSNMIDEMSLLLETERLKFFSSDSINGAWGIGGIRRAIDNLLSNAIKYGEPKTPIEIKLSRKGDLAILSIHNEGAEIPHEFQAKLFNAFQRTQVSENSHTKGWGLGLALVKGIAEAHGGLVKVESLKNAGTTFILELPIRN